MSLAQRINQAKDLGIWLHERTNQKRFPAGIREQTGLAILQLTEDVLDAIIVLIGAQMPGPAWSLARPLFEGYVRGFWLLNCASDEQVIEFINGKCPNFPGLLSAVPKDAESGGAWIHVNSEKNLTAFHDLTHGGSEHVKRRLTDDSVEPNYPEHELESLIELGNEIRMRVASELLSRLNDEKGMEILHERAQVLRAEP
jgi:hypothetical protein